MERSLSFRSLQWVLPLAIATVAAGLTVAELVPMIAVAGVAILACAATAAFPASRGFQRGADDVGRPIGSFVVVAGHGLALVSLVTSGWLNAFVLLVGSGLTLIGVVQIVQHRLGSRPSLSERESFIFSAGIALTVFLLLIENRLDTVSQYLEASALTIGATGALFTVVFLLWFAGHDPAVASMPSVLLIAGQASLVATGVLTAASDSMVAPIQVLTFFAAGLVVASALHPALAETLAPAVIKHSEVDVRRSMITFLVILIGPILVGLNLAIGSLDLSLAVVTIGSSVLSMFVAFHMLQLVRHYSAVEHQGQHDPLTTLPNRPLFFDRLELAIESARLRDTSFATMFLDLDRFKAVNDTLGHDAGDELLRQVAKRLHEASLRVADDLTVARLGGDEFAMLIPHVKDERHAHAIGRLFLDQFLDPFDVGLRDIYVTPSIGIAQFPKDGDTVDQLIENADTAMFEAKERGRNTVVSYSPEQRVPGAHRLEIEAALHRAIDNEELQLLYQPQVDITTGEIFAVEALLRWVHPTLGLIGPDKFVPVAEESSLIDSIGNWTLEEACRAGARWSRMGLQPISVAVNLSARQFQKSVHLTDHVESVLVTTGLEPHRLELELTESLALERPEEVNATLTQFREMGIRTAIDDFGVGHTGLDYLDRISVDTLKIDRSFINRIGESGAPLVTAVISLARGLNLDVIAEGVETKAQVEFLKQHGCRYMQGYLFSKPLTGPQLERVLRTQLDNRRAAEAQAEEGLMPPPTPRLAQN